MNPISKVILVLLVIKLFTSISAGEPSANQNQIIECGKSITIDDNATLNVTRHAQLNNIKTTAVCLMKFEVNPDHEIYLTFDNFQFYNFGGECTTDYLQFGNDGDSDSKRYCTSKPKAFRSSGTKMYIQYKAENDGSLGFTALLKSEQSVVSEKKCPKVTNINDDNQHDVSHNISEGNLQTDSVCTMMFTTDESHIFKLEIPNVDFAPKDSDCSGDYLKFGDSESDLSQPYCKRSPKLVVSARNSFTIQYLAQRRESSGYTATLTRVLKPKCNEKIFLREDKPVEISHWLEKFTLAYNTVCTTEIFADKGYHIELQFIDFYIPYETDLCTNAYVQFESGTPHDTKKYCGNIPYRFFSERQTMFLRYYVKDRNAYGFSATIRRLPIEPIHTDPPPSSGHVTKPPSTGSSSKLNTDATDTGPIHTESPPAKGQETKQPSSGSSSKPNTDATDQPETTRKQTGEQSSTTRTHLKSTILATILFLRILF